jgi:segregation and condensation protein A
MSYLVKLDQFEGPLDLLLHLISKSKVRIEDISITEITEQYLETLRIFEQFDMDIASEFLVMAATLLHIKSCILVPKTKPDPEEEEEADPKQELIMRLLEYKKYKEAGSRLQEREACFSGLFYKLPEEFYNEDSQESALPDEINAGLLSQALMMLLRLRKNLSGKAAAGPLIHEIKRDPITINERVSQLKAYFAGCSQTTFFQLFKKDNSREEIIVTFLALLELLKENILSLQQKYPFEDILIERRDPNG